MSVLDPVHVRRHDLWVNLLQRFVEAVSYTHLTLPTKA